MSSSKIPTAPWEVASDARTLRVGNFLYLDGEKYRCPELTTEETLKIIGDITDNLKVGPIWPVYAVMCGVFVLLLLILLTTIYLVAR